MCVCARAHCRGQVWVEREDKAPEGGSYDRSGRTERAVTTAMSPQADRVSQHTAGSVPAPRPRRGQRGQGPAHTLRTLRNRLLVLPASLGPRPPPLSAVRGPPRTPQAQPPAPFLQSRRRWPHTDLTGEMRGPHSPGTNDRQVQTLPARSLAPDSLSEVAAFHRPHGSLASQQGCSGTWPGPAGSGPGLCRRAAARPSSLSH